MTECLQVYGATNFDADVSSTDQLCGREMPEIYLSSWSHGL